MYDKSERLVKMAEMLRFAINTPVDEEELRRCALLCKTDLVTGMVIEFTELQGVMGREYALLDGEKPEVATGIFEHYLPRFAGDALPATTIGRIVGIGDKLDNICATFSRGLAPTGSQDPYALRRQALGVINILLDANYHISLAENYRRYFVSLGHQTGRNRQTGAADYGNFSNSVCVILLMDQGIRYDVIDAVFADKRNDDVVDLAARCKALAAYVEAGNAEPLVQVSVRVSNLCKKIEKEVAISGALFKDESENKLHEVVAAVSKEIIPEIVLYDYAAVLKGR